GRLNDELHSRPWYRRRRAASRRNRGCFLDTADRCLRASFSAAHCSGRPPDGTFSKTARSLRLWKEDVEATGRKPAPIGHNIAWSFQQAGEPQAVSYL